MQPGAAIEFTYVLASAELPEFAYPTERRSDVLSITMNGEARTACFPRCVTACRGSCCKEGSFIYAAVVELNLT